MYCCNFDPEEMEAKITEMQSDLKIYREVLEMPLDIKKTDIKDIIVYGYIRTGTLESLFNLLKPYKITIDGKNLNTGIMKCIIENAEPSETLSKETIDLAQKLFVNIVYNHDGYISTRIPTKEKARYVQHSKKYDDNFNAFIRRALRTQYYYDLAEELRREDEGEYE